MRLWEEDSMKDKEMELKEKKEVKREASEGTRPGPVFIPAVDILENEQELILLADMPSVNNNNVDIDLRDNQLTITGRIDPIESDKEVTLYREFSYGDYFRQFTVSDKIDQGKISAKMQDGVLRLVLPKVEKMKPQKIKVSVG